MKISISTYRGIMKKFIIFVLFSLSLFGANPKMLVQTTQGSFTLELFPSVAPKACENFITHAKKGYYNGLIFHRIIKGFMIQGGDPTGTGRGGSSIWGRPFADEFSPYLLFDQAGLLAMANSGKNSNGSQFFITTAPTPWLNGYHTIFGRVITGTESIKKLDSTPVGAQDRPLTDQKIISITPL